MIRELLSSHTEPDCLSRAALVCSRSLRMALSFAALASFAFAQEAPPKDAPPPPGRREMPAPKNLKVLEPANVMPSMQAFRTALGVRCSHCHVEGNFASDDNMKKEVARNMILMTRDINAKFNDGKTHVTCYTCHRGAIEPATSPQSADAKKGD